MKTLKFKTNINCASCVAKVTPFLNEAAGENHWLVNTQEPQKILTVESDDVSESDIITSLEKAGYRAEPLS